VEFGVVAEEHQRRSVDERGRSGVIEAGGHCRQGTALRDADVLRVGAEAEVGGAENPVPTAKRVTAAPTAATSPANSVRHVKQT
jgi:hypothetical protein